MFVSKPLDDSYKSQQNPEEPLGRLLIFGLSQRHWVLPNIVQVLLGTRKFLHNKLGREGIQETFGNQVRALKSLQKLLRFQI